jgi:PAS domain S-box-containing protein
VKNRFKISSVSSVRGRAYLTIIVLALLSLLTGVLVVSHVVERTIAENYEIAKATTVEGLSYALAPMLASYEYAHVERLITAILGHRYIASIAVYDINGTLISSVEEEVVASAAVNLETYTISGDGGVVGSLEIGIYTGYISDQVRSTVLALISGLAIIFIVGGFLFSGLFDRFISRPLSYLSKKVTEMTPENLTVRVEQTRDDEFGALAKSINEMAEKLQEYDASRKKTEEMLRQSEERFRMVFEYAPDAYYLNDLEGNFVDGNKATEKLSGYKKEELIGKSFLNLNMLRPEDIQKAAELLIKNANGQSTGPDEFSLTRKDGSQVMIEISTSPVEIRGQALVLGLARDITERKRAEEALLDEANRRRILMEQSRDGIVILNQDGHVYDCNQKFADMVGYPIESMHQLTVFDWEYLYSPERTLEMIRNVDEKGDHFETKHRRKDGSTYDVEISTNAAVFAGQKLIFCVCRDITERRQMQEQLMIADRLASVGELASGIAHELNNPLTGIIGLCQLLAEKDLPEDTKEDLQLVYSEAQRAANIVSGLLSFARRHTPAKQPININDVISKVLELRAYEQKVNNIERVINLAPDLPQVWADYFQMQQVFVNIVTNAEYFMLKAHKKGTLTITTERVEDIIRISFADDGPGIPEKDLGHVFDPFFTTKEVGQGTGLGLSISHGIVTAHGGRIYAESEQGKGATFVVELPIREKEESYEESDSK